MGFTQWIIRTTTPMSRNSRVTPRTSRRRTRCVKWLMPFLGGFALGQIYYHYMVKKIPFPGNTGVYLSLLISLFLGIGNVACVQLRCVSLLTLPMYCGKPGRGVLKIVILTYVIAGPIANMGLNAKEVVRVYACSTELSQNLSTAKFAVIGQPFRSAVFSLRPEVSQVKDTVRSIRDVITPIEAEIEDCDEWPVCQKYSVYLKKPNREKRRRREEIFYKTYLAKLNRRCEWMVSHAIAYCFTVFGSIYDICKGKAPTDTSWVLCQPMKLSNICNMEEILGGYNVCDCTNQSNPGMVEGYVALKKAKKILTDNKDIALQYKINTLHQVYNVQDGKETGNRVMHAFEEKYIIMHAATTAVNICVAVLFLRIFTAAVTYHDQYLTNIEYDNIYITRLFKKIDRKRGKRNQLTLLPLKKMERNKYVDMHSLLYLSSDRDKLVSHILKVLLEVVTATTFVMLDRLFYEALDVVRQHAETELPREGTRDLEIEVEGTGTLANMVRRVLASLNVQAHATQDFSNRQCLPHPRLIPSSYYLKIYGGYLWILFLLYVDPYTVRLKRLVCSYFYPCREKQRILHLYNDILKKRMKMQKMLRRTAVQAVRAHYLSGENMLSLRMKFPRLLGWLRLFPAARMTCLICGETERRNHDQTQNVDDSSWHTCETSKCPFVYCLECWREVGAKCLACDPSLAELSDVDSLSEDDLQY